MAMEDVVRWLRGEHNELNRCADRLREKVAKTPPAARQNWIEDLRARFDDFAACCRQHMVGEEERGYLKPVAEARPALMEAVTLLKREHEELTRIIDSLQRAIHGLTPKARLLLRDCCKRVDDLLYWVERHEEHENHLVLYAFSEAARPQP
jgi:hemerythrin-like domain-containing protein